MAIRQAAVLAAVSPSPAARGRNGGPVPQKGSKTVSRAVQIMARDLHALLWLDFQYAKNEK
jgi:hypothetical protein